MHFNCKAQQYARYRANGWQQDDLEDFYRGGDSCSSQFDQTPVSVLEAEHRHLLKQAELTHSLTDYGNCAPFAWAQAIGPRNAIEHMTNAPAAVCINEGNYVRHLGDWAQLARGSLSLGKPVHHLPEPTEPDDLPMFAV